MGFNPFRRWAAVAGTGKANRDERIRAPENKVYYPKPNAELDAKWKALREPVSGRDGSSLYSRALLDQLPAGLLTHTVRDFPHLIERFAANWSSPMAMQKVFDELTFESRPSRKGFPLAVLSELTELRNFYEDSQRR